MKKQISLYVCCIFFALIGITHFTHTANFTRIVPDYVPFPDMAVYLSGVAEIIGAGLLYYEKSRRSGSYFLILLLLAVFPANIHMAVKHITLGLPEWVLWPRLPLQALLIWWVFRLGKTAKQA